VARALDTDPYVVALVRERAGYVVRGLDDRVAAVDAELARLGLDARYVAKRSRRRRTEKGTP
jgi:hypothetical protein